jgi:hypothetical protein
LDLKAAAGRYIAVQFVEGWEVGILKNGIKGGKEAGMFNISFKTGSGCVIPFALDDKPYGSNTHWVFVEKKSRETSAVTGANKQKRAELEANPSVLIKAKVAEIYQGPHNSRCNYCDFGGKLWQCFHCNLVAHPACLDGDRDTSYLNADREVEWCCSVCIRCHYRSLLDLDVVKRDHNPSPGPRKRSKRSPSQYGPKQTRSSRSSGEAVLQWDNRLGGGIVEASTTR